MIKDDIKSAVSGKNAIFGCRQVIKKLKTKELKAVVFSSNCPDALKKEMLKECEMSNTKYEDFSDTGKQLGMFCGKPFSISVIGIMEKKKK